MIFSETALKGACLVDLSERRIVKGFFARAWCAREFEANGLKAIMVQCNLSYNEKNGTLRGLHYQIAPYEEAKLIRCTIGAIYDVIIDLRRDSATFTKRLAVMLTAAKSRRRRHVIWCRVSPVRYSKIYPWTYRVCDGVLHHVPRQRTDLITGKPTSVESDD